MSGSPLLLEVIACSLSDAVEAERGGAGRLELVRALARGGLTPSIDLVEAVVQTVRIPVRVMIRERDDYAAGGVDGLTELQQTAARFAAAGVEGVVLGFLRGGQIDAEAIDAVLGAAGSVRATFHHAFDDLADPFAALDALQRWPLIDRVLSSGGTGDWRQKTARLERYDEAAAPQIRVLAGGGVDREALRILAASRVREAHAGRAARVPPTTEGRVVWRQVAELVSAARP